MQYLIFHLFFLKFIYFKIFITIDIEITYIYDFLALSLDSYYSYLLKSDGNLALESIDTSFPMLLNTEVNSQQSGNE